MTMLALLLQLADPAAAMMAGANARLSTTRPEARERYRVEATREAAIDPKDRALAERSERCNVVGARVCTSNGRRIFATALDD